jgi:ATP-dependent protease ClpP protease subunit
MDIPVDALNINLYINSCGGEIFGALSTIDRIKSNKIKIHSYVEGIAASAATLLSVVAHKRYIRKNSMMLIHQLSSENWGTYREIKDEVKNLDALMDTIKNIYLNHTKMTETYLNDILNHDIYLKSHECLELGLVDFII